MITVIAAVIPITMAVMAGVVPAVTHCADGQQQLWQRMAEHPPHCRLPAGGRRAHPSQGKKWGSSSAGLCGLSLADRRPRWRG